MRHGSGSFLEWANAIIGHCVSYRPYHLIYSIGHPAKRSVHLVSPELVNGLFALGGAALSAWLTWKLTKRSERRKILTAYFSPFSRLVEVSKTVVPKVTIQLDGQDVQNLFLTELTVCNIGNEAIQSIEISVTPCGPGDLLTYEPDAAFQQLVATTQMTGEHCVVAVPFLNPLEEFVLRFYVTADEKMPVATFRQANVSFRTGTRPSSTVHGALAQAMAEALSRNLLMDVYMRALIPSYRTWSRQRKVEGR